MQKEIKNQIEEIDRIICDKYNLDYRYHTYRKFGLNFIKSSIWPIGVFKNIKTHSELSIFPSAYKRRWLNLLLSKGDHSLTELSGPLFGWFFLKRYSFQTQANFIFYKEYRAGIILLYKDLNIILKAKLLSDTDSISIEFKRTKEAYDQANKIGVLKIPEVFHLSFTPDKYSFFLQERIEGTTLQRLPSDVVAKNIEKLCNFLFLFYQQNTVYLKKPNADMEKMESILSQFYGKEIYSKFLSIKEYFNHLLEEEKKCFWGKTHGDIHTRNLIVDKCDNLWLIDWEASKYEFLNMDFRKIGDNDYLFNNLLTLFPTQQTEIMNKIDQVFIGHLFRLQRSFVGHKKRKSQYVIQFIDLVYDYCLDNYLVSK